MSSTTNVQNLLVNVFRPTYTYEPSTGYSAKLVLSNVEMVAANIVTGSNAYIGDGANNVYVGALAGNNYDLYATKGSSNNVAVGYSAAASICNSQASVYVGYDAGGIGISNASNEVCVGAYSKGGGVSNVYVGANTGSVGSSNIFVGPGIAPATAVSNQLRIGKNSTVIFSGDLASGYAGVNTAVPVRPLDVSGDAYFRNKVGIQVQTPSKTLEVNGQSVSTGGFISIQSTETSFPTGSSTLGLIKKGIILASAVNNASSVDRASKVWFAYTDSNVTELSGSSNGNANLVISSSNIQLSNAGSSAVYSVNITYFPIGAT